MFVLVVCTGNSCRSQLAEAFLRHHGGARLLVHSAGTEPASRVHPVAVQVMAEVDLDLDGQKPKHVGELRSLPVETLITVCDLADRSCPAVWQGIERRMHWPFEDPAAFEGDEAATLAKFREVRDLIEKRVLAWLEESGV